jgi:L-threonate 2-dehydrogenase
MRIGLIGLGDMGAALAPRLTGHVVSGYDPDPARTAGFVAARYVAVSSATELAAVCEVAISLLPSACSLRETARALAGSGLLWIEASTLAVADKIAASEIFGGRMIDAPISGTAGQTAAGLASAFVSGDAADVDATIAILAGPLARAVPVGGFGNGTRVKLCANLLVTLHTACAAEVVLLAEAQGLDPDVMLRAIAGGAASSAMLELRGPQMARGQHVPATGKLAVIAKDRALIEAAAVRTPLPLFRQAFAFFDVAISADPESDLSAVIEAMRGASCHSVRVHADDRRG